METLKEWYAVTAVTAAIAMLLVIIGMLVVPVWGFFAVWITMILIAHLAIKLSRVGHGS